MSDLQVMSYGGGPILRGIRVMKFGSLFAGVGGFDVAEWIGRRIMQLENPKESSDEP